MSTSWSVRAGIVPSGIFALVPVLSNPVESPADEAAPEPTDRENRAINLLMYRDRDRERLLFHAQNHLLAGDVAAALEHMQRILDLQEDLFIWRKSDQKLVSLRSEASRLLEHLDAESLARYQRFVDADAALLLKNAENANDPKLYETVAQRYFHTVHGFHATHWCATRWFDHGYFEMAARAWERLESHPHHRERVTKLMRTKCELARQLASKSPPQPKPLVRVADNSVTASGTRLDVIPVAFSETEPQLAPLWMDFQGGWDRTESVAATTPFLNPDWLISYTTGTTPAVGTTLKLWEEKQGRSLHSKATAGFPIVVKEHVIFRDFRGIRCIDRTTGASRWSYRCETSLQNELDRLDEKYGHDGVHSSRSGSYVQMQSDYAANSILGLLSSDGTRIFAVDEMALNAGAPDPDAPTTLDPRKSNQLLALPLDPASPGDVKPLWKVGGVEKAEVSEPALAGHFFRGPPLPIDGRLYAVTEVRNQLNLVALEAETGKLLWKQGIAFSDESFDVDHDRYPLACPIAFGDGVLICPTQTGLLVGVDAMSGTLLWSYCYSEELYLSDQRGWRDRYSKSWGSEGFPAAPKVHGRQVVFLPRQSQEIHCLDVRTGRRVWTVPREDAEYIGAVTGEMVLIVGQRYCRGLNISSGEEQWSARFGMPAGQGISAGGRYLLPLESGRIATIHLKTGREIGLSGLRNSKPWAHASAGLQDMMTRIGLPANPLPEGWHAGNLIPAGDRILACGASGLMAFPQTGELLNRRVRNQLIAAPEDSSTRLLAAELQLNLGQLGAAKANLETVLAPQQSHQLRPHGEFLLRELLFRQLENEPIVALPLLEELESLVTSPADRGRFLMRKADYQLRTRDLLGAWKSAQALIALDNGAILPWPRNPEHEIAPRTYAARLMQHLREEMEPADLVQVQHQVEYERASLLTSGTAEQMQHFLALYSAWPQSAGVRQRLAEMARERGEFQRAEFLWLKNAETKDPAVVAEAKWQLMTLWSQLGLYSEAAVLAEELTSPMFADVRLMDGRTAKESLARIPAESLLGQAIDRRSLPMHNTDRVEISEHRWTPTEGGLLDAFSQYRREFSLMPGSTFQLLDKGWVDEDLEVPETRVAVIDRTAGVIQGKVRLPLQNSYPSLSKRSHVGHFFPIGSTNRMTGVSLLEIEQEEPLWKTKLGEGAAHQHMLRPGPSGPDYCTFQGAQELVVLDPATGQTLWMRSDLDHSSGLVSDPYAGLFGDEDVLVLFDSDRSGYTVYETQTGEELHHGQLDIDTGQIRRIFGRKLFYITNTQEGRRMRIWDFGKNELVFDRPAGMRIFSALTPDQELVVLIPPDPDEGESAKSSRLQVLDVINDRVLLDFEVPEEDLKNLNYVRAFRHGDRFYVNLQCSVQMPAERLFSYYASDAFPPVENIQGELFAVDPQSGKVLWKRMLPQRSILQMPHLRLPFLVMISRVRDRWQGGKQGLLVEVLDAETGETIACKDNNLSDRVVNLAYDREKGLLDLNGLKTRIRLKFGPAVARIPSDNEPL